MNHIKSKAMPVTADCTSVRAGFSAYLDGSVSGVEMAAIAEHLEGCAECAQEFALWRSVQHNCRHTSAPL